MRKGVIFIIVVLMTISFLGEIKNGEGIETTEKITKNTLSRLDDGDFTHTVFVEYATATWCSACPTASEAMYKVYQEGNYSMFFITLVGDKNPIAKDRMRKYHTIAVPTVYFDGGYSLKVGHSGDVNATVRDYKNLIEKCGDRRVKKVDVSTNVIWVKDEEIKVDVRVSNPTPQIYIGRVRSYITEVESRWVDYKGNNYHFALLDSAVDEPVVLMPFGEKKFISTWNSSHASKNQVFNGLTSNNTMVISVVTNWVPHPRMGYRGIRYKQVFLAFFVDDVDAATPS